MTIEADISFLKYFPTTVFKQLAEKWQKTSIELKPKNLLSDENRDQAVEFIESLTKAKFKQLTKLSEMLNISEVWWEIYQISKILPLSNLEKHDKNFTVQKYLPRDHTKVKGIFSILELSEHAIMIYIEFSSRTLDLRRTFRYIYFPTARKILVEPNELAIEVLNNEILPFITKEPNNLVKKPVRARIIKNLTKKTDESEEIIVLTDLTIKVSLETSGIEGLNKISIQGDDVIRGAETLEQRHEISLKFMNSGPWIGAGTKDFKLEIGKGIQIHQLEEFSLKKVATVLNQF